MRQETYTKDMKRSRALPVSRADLKRILDRLEDVEDEIAVLKAQDRGPSVEALPQEFMRRIVRGEHPLRVWRDYRGLTQKQLAAKAKLTGNHYISEIEQGLKTGSAKTLGRLARVLGCSLEVLVRD